MQAPLLGRIIAMQSAASGDPLGRCNRPPVANDIHDRRTQFDALGAREHFLRQLR